MKKVQAISNTFFTLNMAIMKDKRKIAKKASLVQNENDLLKLLNEIKLDLMPRGYPFSKYQLHCFCHPERNIKEYIKFSVPKKSGGERTINAPTKGLKCIQSCVRILLDALYTPSEPAMGFVQGRSIVDNAKKHLNKNYVYNIDLKDFFPSIKQGRVWKRLQLAPFNFPFEVASLLAGICCIKTDGINERGKCVCVLPQGSPVSPLLTNAICDVLDQKLNKLAKKFELTYSRYADDITFSSNHNVFGEDSTFCKELQRIVTQQGFEINEKKTRLQKFWQRQEVTGLIVSNKVNTCRKYVRELRQLLYMWEHYGYNTAYLSFKRHHYERVIPKRKVLFIPKLDAVIEGKLNYLKMVKGEKDSVYQNLKQKKDQLTGKPKERNPQIGLQFIATEPVEQFEKKYFLIYRFNTNTFPIIQVVYINITIKLFS